MFLQSQSFCTIYSPLLLNKEKLRNTWKSKLPHSPQLVTPLPGQTPLHSPWQNTWGSSMCAHGPESAPTSLQRVEGSERPRWGGWRETQSPNSAGAFLPSPPRQTATKSRGCGKRSHSWQKQGAPGWGWHCCTCCILVPCRTLCCGGQQIVCRSSRVRRSWSRRPTGWWALCPVPGCPCAGCRRVRSSGYPQPDLWVWMFLLGKEFVYFSKLCVKVREDMQVWIICDCAECQLLLPQISWNKSSVLHVKAG